MRGCARGATVERSETGERTMIVPAGQSTARACLRSKLAALVVRRQAGPRLRGCTPLRTPKRKSEVSAAKRTQYYCPFLTPPSLPPLLSREFPRTPAAFNGRIIPRASARKKDPLLGELAEPARPEGSRRALRHHPFPGNRPSTAKGRAAALPCPSRAQRFTAVRRGRACPARGLAMLPVNGLNPSGLLRGHLP